MSNPDALIATHAPLLAQAREAARARTYFAAFAESPSTRIWGEAAPPDGRAAFDALLHQTFPIQTPGARGLIAPEEPPYGMPLDISYPHLHADGVDELVGAAKKALPAWRDAGPEQRIAIGIEILTRINARSFEFAHAVMHTTGQAFVMAFQAGGAHAHERGLEAMAYAYDAMTQVPASVSWEKARGKGEPQRLAKTYTVVPRGVAVVIGCSTVPTWNSYPGLFASLVTGNPVIVKPHPHAVLPLALTVGVARDVLTEYGFDPNLITLAVDGVGETVASTLAMHPDVRVIDYTGSTSYGEWLEANALQARVFTEKAGVNCVVLDSTDDLSGLAANLAYSLSLYSGQMCTTPQTIFIPRNGIDTDNGHASVADVVGALGAALDDLLGDPARAVNMLGAIVDDRVLHRLDEAPTAGEVLIKSRAIEHPEFAAARVRTPLVVRASDAHAYSHECFGPIAFIVETADTAASLDAWSRIVTTAGSLTASVYSTDADVLAAAHNVALDTGVSMSSNLTADTYVNQTTAFSDYHGTGANRAANATLTDLAFVADRFRIVETRHPVVHPAQ
jgi:phenylacetic acid degradation protein paaN